jgi:hypothetical protein
MKRIDENLSQSFANLVHPFKQRIESLVPKLRFDVLQSLLLYYKRSKSVETYSKMYTDPKKLLSLVGPFFVEVRQFT